MKKALFVLVIAMSITSMAVPQVAINTTGANPHASAMLDVNSSDKGLLLPRVSIPNLSNASPVTSPATGLIVYNTNVATGPGIFLWDGSAWSEFSTGAADVWIDANGNVLSLNASSSALSGSGNIGIGTGANANTVSDYNVALGYNAMNNHATSGNYVNAIGYEAAANDASASPSHVNAIGSYAANHNSGEYLNAIGRDAAANNTGEYVNAIGENSAANNSGDYVNAYGSNAANSNSGNHVNAIGSYAANSNTVDYNDALGYYALADHTTTGNYIVAIGYFAGRNDASLGAAYVNSIGYRSGYGNSGNSVNIFGRSAGESNIGDYLNALGESAASNNSGDYANIFGHNTGQNNSGLGLNAIGRNAAFNNSGDYNNVIGYYAYQGTGGASYINAIGWEAARNDASTGNSHVNAIGSQAAYQNTGTYLNALGRRAAYDNEGTGVSAIGEFAGELNRGDNVNLMGEQAGRYNTADNVVASGYLSAYNNAGDYLVALGYRAAYNNTQNYVNVIGRYEADAPQAEATILAGDLFLKDPNSSGGNTTGNALRFNDGGRIFGTATGGVGISNLPVAGTNDTLMTINAGVISKKQESKLSIIPLWQDIAYNMTNTSGQDLSNCESALIPTLYASDGDLDVKLVIRTTSSSGTINFQLRTHNGTTETYPIVNTDSWTSTSVQTGCVHESEWKNFNAGTTPCEVHLHGWVSSGGSADFPSAYLVVRAHQ